jgi:acetyl-CoA carboxylase biotin carboxyl carrier protein
MDEQNIRKYARLMQELGLTGLEFSENGSSIRLEMSCPEQASVRTVYMPEAHQNEAVKQENGLLNICSPMVGVFYNAPAENAAPFVKVGDSVKKGDILCIIEAMKLMNEITADQDGIIAEVCVGNEQIVDFGHVLFRLRKN